MSAIKSPAREATIKSFRARSIKVQWIGDAPQVERLREIFGFFGIVSTVRVKERTALVLYKEAVSVETALRDYRGPLNVSAIIDGPVSRPGSRSSSRPSTPTTGANKDVFEVGNPRPNQSVRDDRTGHCSQRQHTAPTTARENTTVSELSSLSVVLTPDHGMVTHPIQRQGSPPKNQQQRVVLRLKPPDPHRTPETHCDSDNAAFCESSDKEACSKQRAFCPPEGLETEPFSTNGRPGQHANGEANLESMRGNSTILASEASFDKIVRSPSNEKKMARPEVDGKPHLTIPCTMQASSRETLSPKPQALVNVERSSSRNSLKEPCFGRASFCQTGRPESEFGQAGRSEQGPFSGAEFGQAGGSEREKHSSGAPFGQVSGSEQEPFSGAEFGHVGGSEQEGAFSGAPFGQQPFSGAQFGQAGGPEQEQPLSGAPFGQAGGSEQAAFSGAPFGQAGGSEQEAFSGAPFGQAGGSEQAALSGASFGQAGGSEKEAFSGALFGQAGGSEQEAFSGAPFGVAGGSEQEQQLSGTPFGQAGGSGREPLSTAPLGQPGGSGQEAFSGAPFGQAASSEQEAFSGAPFGQVGGSEQASFSGAPFGQAGANGEFGLAVGSEGAPVSGDPFGQAGESEVAPFSGASFGKDGVARGQLGRSVTSQEHYFVDPSIISQCGQEPLRSDDLIERVSDSDSALFADGFDSQHVTSFNARLDRWLKPRCASISFGFGGRSATVGSHLRLVAPFFSTAGFDCDSGASKYKRPVLLGRLQNLDTEEILLMGGSCAESSATFPYPLLSARGFVSLPSGQDWRGFAAKCVEFSECSSNNQNSLLLGRTKTSTVLWASIHALLVALLKDQTLVARIDPKGKDKHDLNTDHYARVRLLLLNMAAPDLSSASKAPVPSMVYNSSSLESLHSTSFTAVGEIESLLAEGNALEAINLAIDGRSWALALALADAIDDRGTVRESVLRRFLDFEVEPWSATHTCLRIIASSTECPSARNLSRRRVLYDSADAPPGDELRKRKLGERWCTVLATALAYASVLPRKTSNVIGELGDELSTEFGALGACAAHLAYMLAGEQPFRSPTPMNRVALLGWCHADSTQRASFAHIISAMRRTEVLDFALGLRGGLTNHNAGRFRLLHAEFLCDVGQFNPAWAICGAIRAASTANGTCSHQGSTSVDGRNQVAQSSPIATSCRSLLNALAVLEDRIVGHGVIESQQPHKAETPSSLSNSVLGKIGSWAGDTLTALTACEDSTKVTQKGMSCKDVTSPQNPNFSRAQGDSIRSVPMLDATPVVTPKISQPNCSHSKSHEATCQRSLLLDRDAGHLSGAAILDRQLPAVISGSGMVQSSSTEDKHSSESAETQQTADFSQHHTRTGTRNGSHQLFPQKAPEKIPCSARPATSKCLQSSSVSSTSQRTEVHTPDVEPDDFSTKAVPQEVMVDGKPPSALEGSVQGPNVGTRKKNKVPSKDASLDAKPGWFRRKIASVLYPDAKQVSLDDTSAKMEAYYDKTLKRWVFPDADGSVPDLRIEGPPAGPPKVPPTIAALSSEVNELKSSQTAVVALPRRSSSSPAMSVDPLAAMMAPPPMRSMPNPAARKSGDAMTIRAPKISQSVPSFATFAVKPVGPSHEA